MSRKTAASETDAAEAGPVIAYRYTAPDRYLLGVPARDLTADEYAAIPEDFRDEAQALYTPVDAGKQET